MVVGAVARDHGLGLVVERQPELVPRGALAVGGAHGVDLLEGGVCELEHVDHADDLSALVHHREVEVVSI